MDAGRRRAAIGRGRAAQLAVERLGHVADLTLELTRDAPDLGEGSSDLSSDVGQSFRPEQQEREHRQQQDLAGPDASHRF
jgi:hypothetical protein